MSGNRGGSEPRRRKRTRAAAGSKESDAARDVAQAAPLPLDRRDAAIAAALALAALCLYGTTLCRSIYWGDSAEFAVAVPLLEIAHPTGYPLFSLLGKLVTLLPIGSLALRVNLISALGSAAASGMAYLVARRLGLGRFAAAVGGGLFAVSRELWEQSAVAEVYSLQAALTGAVLFAALGFRARPDRRRLTLLGAALGLSFANHMTTLWTGPAVLWLVRDGVLRARRDAPDAPGPLSATSLLPAAAAFAAGVSLYLFLPLRSLMHPLFNDGAPSTLGALIDHVSGRQFQYRMAGDVSSDALATEVAKLGALLWDQFTPWLLPLAALGPGLLWRRDRTAAIALLLLVGANLAFTLTYKIPDKSGYYLPVFLVAALGVAEAVSWLGPLLAHSARPAARQPIAAALALLVIGLPLLGNHAAADQSANRSLADYTDEVMKRLPPDALLFVEDVALYYSSAYAQVLEGRYPGLVVVNPYLLCLPWYIDQLRRRFPQLVIPPSVDQAVARRTAAIAAAEDKAAVGALSHRVTDAIAKDLAEANLPRRPVYWSYPQVDEQATWQGFPLLNRGLVYEVRPLGETVERAPWDIDYPDPARYRKDAILDHHWAWVARMFSTSCSRDGIALIGAGRVAEAEAAFLRALEYDPEYAQAELNLGVLYQDHLHDRARRDEHWRRYLALDPKNPQARAVANALAAP